MPDILKIAKARKEKIEMELLELERFIQMSERLSKQMNSVAS